ncbi:MAG: SRPBCC domain-containing protein [Melioribacteraceae bacterium]|nr:MAG: SRPBCC domain-containing protein [Melioribacteraceae bacterium]
MIKIKYSITIDASKEKVWHTMLDQETYKLWTEAFSPGSHYVGNWDKGSKIHFLGPDKDGNLGGMVSRIKENRPYEYISIEHLGFFINGKEDTESEAAKSMAGALENYTLIESDGKTEVLVDMDSTEEYEEMFNDMWPKALNKLKELAEK